jgi:hypothetical protein
MQQLLLSQMLGIGAAFDDAPTDERLLLQSATLCRTLLQPAPTLLQPSQYLT